MNNVSHPSLANWPAKRIQAVNNCVIRSYMVGMHIRLGQPLLRCLIKLESILLLDKDIQPVFAAPEQPSNARLFRDEDASTVTPSHEQLMKKLQQDMGVSYEAVYNGYQVEEALLKLANIPINQQGAFYRRRENSNQTYFKLHLNDAKTLQQFTDYYKTHFSGSILKSAETNANGWYEIDFDTNILYHDISPALKKVVQLSTVSTSFSTAPHLFLAPKKTTTPPPMPTTQGENKKDNCLVM